VRTIGDMGREAGGLDSCLQLLASLLRATKGEECDEFMEGVRKGEMRTLQLDLNRT